MATVNVNGNVGRDPELRTSSKGTAWTTVNIADKVYDRQAGEKVTTWYEFSFFGKTAERICQNVTKGSGLSVTGVLGKLSEEDVKYKNGKGEGLAWDFLPGGAKSETTESSAQDSVPF